jgi:nucleotide-binding universal stress UspA family protein
MFERILVPLDGSELAESVLTQVRPILTHKDAELLLLRVVTLPSAGEEGAGEPLSLLWSRATEYLQKIAQRLSSQGARVRTKVLEGFPASRVLEVARKERVTLIALSTHGRTGLPRWVFGSVAEKVLRGSPVPVLAMPSFVGMGGDAFVRGAQELPFKTIVVPIAAAPLSLEVLPPLTEFARLFGSSVLLVNVCAGEECSVPVHEMRMAYEKLREGGVTAEPLVKQGDAASQILETCREKGADLIAMTTHGRSGVPRWLLGSVAEKVLRAANVPLLVVRPAKAVRPAPRTAMPVEFHSDP